MADKTLPPPSPEQRRIAVERYDRARQVVTTGNLDYGMQLLLACCKLDPASLTYRQELRRAQKKKHKNNMRGAALAFLTTARFKTRIRSAKRAGDYLKVLEYGEEALCRNPWDRSVQLEMGAAAEALGLTDIAVFILEQARDKHANDVTVNRALAHMLEKRGNFNAAIKLWEQIRKAVPNDFEAATKAKDLAASETIRRGHYEDAIASDAPIRTMQHNNQKAAAERESKAEVELQEKLQTEPTEPEHYVRAASNLRKTGRGEEAIELLSRGLAATGNDFRLQVELAECELEPFRLDLASTERQLTDRPADETLQGHRARLRKEINAREMDLFRMKAERFPSELQHRLDLGIRLMRAGLTDEAITELQAARKDERLYGKAALNLGRCFKERKNWRLAQRNFEEASKRFPAGDEATHKEILYQLATGNADAGDLAKAIDYAHELVDIDFSYRDISRRLDEWQQKLQKA